MDVGRCSCNRTSALRTELAYLTTLPNYGNAWRKPRCGSREPYVYLQFILDFWANLPPVVVFTQDGCLDRTCVWGRALPRLASSLRHWPQVWDGRPMQEAAASCQRPRMAPGSMASQSFRAHSCPRPRRPRALAHQHGHGGG